MKFTNVKQLIIKFMGGGLINFPTRFLRWVKINGDVDDSDDGGGDSTEIDYEAIYQFYKKEITESAPEPLLLGAIIPEHLSDVQDVSIHNDEYVGKMGIWKINKRLADGLRNITILHAIDVASGSVYYIYFGLYYEGGEIN